jgi:hypothetical protein
VGRLAHQEHHSSTSSASVGPAAVRIGIPSAVTHPM